MRGKTPRCSLREQIFDGTEEAQPEDDCEPPVPSEDGELTVLLRQAEALSGEAGDPKLQALALHLKLLLDGGFSPVVFCRYIATAHYLHKHLKSRYAGVTVDVVTGEFTPEERRQRVEAFDSEAKNLLIATDCLSEGVNLQQPFSAVVHYDLSWNPTRHEQREGRVDRFGQPRKLVRATLMYGRNNPVDAAVLEVILRKAKKIRDELGVPVPVPDDEHSLTQALLQAVLLRRKLPDQRTQMAFNFETLPEARAFDVAWTNIAERAKRNRTVFAQTRLQPAEVLPEWQKMQAALGSADDVLRFTQRALARLGSGLNARSTGASNGYRLALNNLPENLRERLLADGFHGTVGISFGQPPAQGTRFVHRSHPLTGILADGLLEATLADAGLPAEGSPGAPDPAVLGRAGCWATTAVESRTTVLLLRLRHQLSSGRDAGTLLVEEAAALALPAKGAGDPAFLVTGQEPLGWLTSPVAEQVDDRVRQAEVERALAQWPQWQPLLEAFAHERADALLADHVRVREASDPDVRRGRRRDHTSVAPLLPVDVIGMFVLLPALGF